MFKKLLFSFLMLLCVLPAIALAEDTTEVQVLTFGDISKRRTIAHFPDGEQKYRKILMYYRLKCDAATTWDKYRCGEWDYLAYTQIHKPTGVMDSTKKTFPLYKIKGLAPDTILLGTEAGKTTYQHYKYDAVRLGGTDDLLLEFNGEDKQSIMFGSDQSFKMQFTYNKLDIKNQGTNKARINNLRLFAEKAGKIKNFTIRMKISTDNEAPGFIRDGMDIVFSQKEIELTEGWNEFVFYDSDLWTNFRNLAFEISGEKYEAESLPVFEGYANTTGYISQGYDNALYYDGGADVVNCGVIKELTAVSKCTFEAWVKIDQWKNWKNIMTIGDKAGIQLGDNEGQLYAILRSKKNETSYNNIHGNVEKAIKIGEWAHVAMVFDGTAQTNSGRLKLYVNGVQKTLTFNDNIPATTYIDPQDFSFGDAGFNGSIDEVRVFNTAVSEEAIIAMKDQGKDIVMASHPNKDKLIAYYALNQNTPDLTATNAVSGSYAGTLVGTPKWVVNKPYDYYSNVSATTALPHVQILTGEHEFKIDSTIYEEESVEEIATLYKYKEEDYVVAVENARNVNIAGWFYTYSPEGFKTDSMYMEPTETVVNDTIIYYLAPYEVYDNWEIARYITPYGKGFDLGPDGFLWVYDVTDYADFFKGDVDISAHNTQELIDLKFLLIEGTPPRDVVAVERIWDPMKSYSYRDMSDDNVLSNTTHTLVEGATQAKVITRLTGHGHERNEGASAHCCEWKTNVHSLLVNGSEKRFDWLIWRDDCGTNPIGNQGGTWPGSREGWCPGDLVRDTEFEVTDYVHDGKISFDYEITPVPENNQGMGTGNYIVAMHLVEYGNANFKNDAEVYQVITPNDWKTYVNRSLICDNAKIVVRNNGESAIESIKFEYYVTGAETHKIEYTWTGEIAPNAKDTLGLPIGDQFFWMGSAKPKFHVNILEVNGVKDDNEVNDHGMTYFTLPEMYNEKIVFELKTNTRGEDFYYSIIDLEGKPVFERNSLSSNKIYRDTLAGYNCYMMVLNDRYSYGLEYWAVPKQGEGYLNIYNMQGQLLKAFDPDCGQGYQYAFNMGEASHVEDPGFEEYIKLSPMPCKNSLNLDFNSFAGEIDITVFDVAGRKVMSQCAVATNGETITLDVTVLNAGFYYIVTSNGKKSFKQKFIKE